MCPTSFGEIKELTHHKNKCHSVLIECSSCKSKFGKLEELTKHAKLCSQFKCNLCPTLKFRSIEDLALHKKQLHPMLMPFHCTYCSSSFAKSEELFEHVSDLHKNSTFKCSLCPTKSFKSSKALDQHNKAKHSFHSFKCDLCPSQFVDLVLLTQHKLTQHKAKNHPVYFGCNYCVNCFSSLVDLNNHVKSDHRFICDICSSFFMNMDLLTQHKEKNHPADFGCDYCVNRFSSLANLNNHIKSDHTFQCNLCLASPALFRKKKRLTQHKEKYHPAIFGCNYCVNRFPSLDELNNHVTSVHRFQKMAFWGSLCYLGAFLVYKAMNLQKP
jgi:hypothetical protein